MFFFAPNQVINIEVAQEKPLVKPVGWILLIHHYFFWDNSLAKSISQYDFFHYAVKEALFLSEKEKVTITNIFKNIRYEYRANIDRFSTNITISQLELLFNFAERCYERQFYTRRKNNHKILERTEESLSNYVSKEHKFKNGLPTVNYLAENLNISPIYLSNLLKHLTGQSTQQLIHEKLIQKAK